MIPCKDCIALPACRYKQVINCPMLFEWNTSKTDVRYKETKIWIPNLRIIMPNDKWKLPDNIPEDMKEDFIDSALDIIFGDDY